MDLQINGASRSACLKYSPYLIEKDAALPADLRRRRNNASVRKTFSSFLFPFNSDFKEIQAGLQCEEEKTRASAVKWSVCGFVFGLGDTFV